MRVIEVQYKDRKGAVNADQILQVLARAEGCLIYFNDPEQATLECTTPFEELVRLWREAR